MSSSKFPPHSYPTTLRKALKENSRANARIHAVITCLHMARQVDQGLKKPGLSKDIKRWRSMLFRLMAYRSGLHLLYPEIDNPDAIVKLLSLNKQ